MSRVDDLLAKLFRRLLAEPERAAAVAVMPVIGGRLAEFARQTCKRQTLLAMADSLEARRPNGALALELHAASASMIGLNEFADTLYAEAARRRALALSPALDQIRVARSVDPARARSLSTAAASKFPRAARAIFAQATDLWLAGDTEAALAACEKALGLDPSLADAQHTRAYLAYQLGRADAKPQGLAAALAARLRFRPGEGDTLIGIFDYKSPDLAATSSNLGDHIQSLAMLRHIARYATPDWRFTGKEVASIVADLRTTWGDGVADAAQPAPVSLLEVDRDCVQAEADKHPGRIIWLPTFGWFMHPPFGARLPLPFPDNVRPFFISLHLNRSHHLTPEVIAYLKRYEPIGCRDWATCYWLRNVGVEAFFSGCVTVTLSLPGERKVTAGPLVVDPTKRWLAANPGPHKTLTQVGGGVRHGRFGRLLERAVERLRQFEGAERIATSRLHCYLPSLALGVPVEFEPHRLGDRRFDGLYGLDANAKDRIRNGIIDKLAVTLGAITAGKSEADVYAIWRAACAEDVAAARAKLEAGRVARAPVVASPAIVKPDLIDVAISFDRKIFAQVPTVLNSIDKTARKRVRFHAQTRGLKPADVEPLARYFARHEFNFIPMDGRLEKQKVHLISHTTLATMDRLFLPELLPDVDRLAYVDIDTVVLSDIDELYGQPVGETGIAARPSISEEFSSQIMVVERVARPLGLIEAAEARRIGARDVDLLAPAFNAGVLVLSLERLRALDCTARTIELVERFQMNDQYALNIFSGGRFAHLPRAWNAFPYQEDVGGAKLLHWAGLPKPWTDRPVRAQRFWRQHALSLDAVRAAPARRLAA
ncbi:MAG: glycosyltransferase [Geminicoccaceae bacterium]